MQPPAAEVTSGMEEKAIFVQIFLNFLLTKIDVYDIIEDVKIFL